MHCERATISILGLDDEERVRRINRLLTLADKEGGLGEVERRLALCTIVSSGRSPTTLEINGSATLRQSELKLNIRRARLLCAEGRTY